MFRFAQKVFFPLFLLMACPAFAATAPTGPNFMFSKDVQPGMQFTGYTCFHGSQIDTFTGTVIGVEQGETASRNLIWTELQIPTFEEHGVAAGMSGSPCYINGKLIGAVAYGFSYSQKPFCGVTPIESMLNVLDLTKQNLTPGDEDSSGDVGDDEGDARDGGGIWTLDELTQMALRNRLPGSAPLRLPVDQLPEAMKDAVTPETAEVELKPLAMPLAISSEQPEVYHDLKEFAAAQGIDVVPGAVAGTTPDASQLPPLVGGSALGMPMVTGDLTVGGYGTVTYCDGNHLVGFGHPAFDWGTTDIPMSPCVMFSVLPSFEETFKMGQVATPIGAIRQDRHSGVGGVIGPTPAFVPMHVHVKSTSTGRENDFHFKIWDNRHWLPILAVTAFSQALMTSDHSSGQATADVHYTIGIRGAEPLSKTLYYSSLTNASSHPSASLMTDLSLLKSNPFKPTAVQSIDLDMVLGDRIRQAHVVSVTADKDVYRPGDTVHLAIYLQPFRGSQVRQEIELPLSRDLDDGSYELFVGDDESRLALEKERAPGIFSPMNYEQMLEAMRRSFAGNQLYVVLERSEEGLTVHGQELPELPPSLRSTFASSSEHAFIKPTSGEFLAEKDVPGPWEFAGSQKLTIQVNRSGRR